MRKLLRPVLLFLLGVGLILAGSCSDKGTEPVEGDLNDPSYQMMSSILAEGVNSFDMTALKISTALKDSVFIMGGVSKPRFKVHQIDEDILAGFEYTYSYDNYWHIFEVAAKITGTGMDSGDSLNVAGIDSLRFQNSGTPVQYPDSVETDELNIRQHFNIAAYSATGQMFEIDNDAMLNITADAIVDNQYTLDGNGSDAAMAYIEDDQQGIACAMELTVNTSINELVLIEDNECPVSGSTGMTAGIDIACEGQDASSLEVNGTWVATWSFADGYTTTVIEHGGTRWEAVEPCIDY